jgi:antitoxin HicB
LARIFHFPGQTGGETRKSGIGVTDSGNGQEALAATIAALKSKALPVPAAYSDGIASGKFVARVPRSTHAQLTTRAKAEGVSLNTLVVTFIAQGLGRKEGRA